MEKSTQPPSFSDLPKEILFKILDELDPIHRLLTRNVSRQLRSIIDCLDPTIRELTFFDDDGDLTIFTDGNHSVRFQEGSKVDYKMRKNTVKGACHVNLALNFLMSILSNPKLKLDTFNLYKYGEKMGTLNEFVEFFAGKLETKKIQAKHFEVRADKSINLNSILAILEPGTLEFIQVELYIGCKFGLYEVMNTEHFKKAKRVQFLDTEPLDPSEIQKFLHLPVFDCHVCSISLEDVFMLTEMLSKSWKTFEECCICSSQQLDLGEIAAAVDEEVEDERYIDWEFSIPDTNHFLYFEFYKTFVNVRKILS
ncbi:unnamed protein product [Caenorhabditis brenneri]